MEKENNKVDLNIDELAFVLCNLMQNSKNWKEDIKVSDNPKFRKIRNHFDFFEIEKTASFEETKLQLNKYRILLD